MTNKELAIKDQTYHFTKKDLEEVLFQVAGATSGVFLREDPQKVMPSQQIEIAVEEWVEASADIFERAEIDVIETGSAILLGRSGIEKLRALIDSEGTSSDYEFFRVLFDKKLSE